MGMIEMISRKIFGHPEDERPPEGPSLEELAKRDKDLERRLQYLMDRVQVLRRNHEDRRDFN